MSPEHMQQFRKMETECNNSVTTLTDETKKLDKHLLLNFWKEPEVILHLR